ncbi:undecaprenyl-phosphate glucose phosphotransferase [Shewanella sp. 1_MG-2023]|uniref:undecaprenyl-phosphate glucose phosphotransferase n=1 Tax=unclassified Shewanella TaxID=196818 RepID=UPI0026E3B9B1|nr:MULTISPECIES: undecaprenyl-phosphate glucose phosphotransferase [unclassified Shewanella]MDO6613515.1 undecaprenyl-phosphate glucose phosphotransferase [Shewanella sp. 7_MG-2023]MDO6773345.1 undecaprenyl-phosphate glucose phosphotransferase [Shewanella sp. 2_MG-2023]MDO6795996.1 undecaprenyl-phosphate glucose phosphotransferase [Shewanella sp. 1_MG-2023]
MDKPSNFHVARNGLAFAFRLADVSFLIAAFFIMLSFHEVAFDREYFLLLMAELFFYLYLAESISIYRSWRLSSFLYVLGLMSTVLVVSFFILITAVFLFKQGDYYSRVVMFGWFSLSMILLVGWRLLVRIVKRSMRRNGYSLQKVAIIGMTQSGTNLYQELNENIELGLQCVGFYDDREPDRINGEYLNLLNGSIDKAVAMAKKGEVKKLYICLPMLAEKRISNIIHQLGDSTVDVLILPDFLLKNLMHARIGHVGDLDTISVFESPVHGMKNFYKRTFDILFSSLAIIAISPVLMVIAIAIKLTSPGAVIFKQDRYGLGGERIKVFKFRSMTVTENAAKVTQATKNDSRLTSIGGFLRRTSLDELPQFFNVLLGTMSVVGPRPHAVAHNEEYRQLVAYYMLRHKVRPGITGWAQVNGWRGETDTIDKMEKRVEYDLAYIRHWSLWWDVKIIFKTIFKGFTGNNAY